MLATAAAVVVAVTVLGSTGSLARRHLRNGRHGFAGAGNFASRRQPARLAAKHGRPLRSLCVADSRQS